MKRLMLIIACGVLVMARLHAVDPAAVKQLGGIDFTLCPAGTCSEFRYLVDLTQHPCVPGSNAVRITNENIEIPDPFWISTYEVNAGLYERYQGMSTTSNLPPLDALHRRLGDDVYQDVVRVFGAAKRAHEMPVIGLSFREANAYCDIVAQSLAGEWLSDVVDFEIRLPTAAEWQYAAQGAPQHDSELNPLGCLEWRKPEHVDPSDYRRLVDNSNTFLNTLLEVLDAKPDEHIELDLSSSEQLIQLMLYYERKHAKDLQRSGKPGVNTLEINDRIPIALFREFVTQSVNASGAEHSPLPFGLRPTPALLSASAMGNSMDLDYRSRLSRFRPVSEASIPHPMGICHMFGNASEWVVLGNEPRIAGSSVLDSRVSWSRVLPWKMVKKTNAMEFPGIRLVCRVTPRFDYTRGLARLLRDRRTGKLDSEKDTQQLEQLVGLAMEDTGPTEMFEIRTRLALSLLKADENDTLSLLREIDLPQDSIWEQMRFVSSQHAIAEPR